MFATTLDDSSGSRRWRRDETRWLRRSLALLLVAALLSCGDDAVGPDGRDDTTPPIILSVSPADGSSLASIHATVSVTFSEPVAPASVTGASFYLTRGGETVSGEISQAGQTVELTPANPLEFVTAYTATVTTAITDAAGNALAGGVEWSFTTAAAQTAHISDADILAHLAFLAADSLYGRRAGSAHERRAADYIRDRFQAIGLEAGVPDYLQTFDIPVAVDGQSGLQSQNVIGVLPGQGSLAGQWVVVGAHYDHVGFEQISSDSVVVYNGADDNASGTALMLDLARALQEYLARAAGGGDRRSIMFQAYGAEEVGLVGSVFYCQQPTVVMDSIVAMVNLDMVGRLRDDVLAVIGTSSSSGWADLLSAANVHSLLLDNDESLIGRSDQLCFYQEERPVALLHTGLHGEYHTPFDDVALINRPGMVRVGDLAAALLLDLIARSDRLPFTGDPLVLSHDAGAPGELAVPR